MLHSRPIAHKVSGKHVVMCKWHFILNTAVVCGGVAVAIQTKARLIVRQTK